MLSFSASTALIMFIVLLIGGFLGWLFCANTRQRRLTEVKRQANTILEKSRKEAEDNKKTSLLEARNKWRIDREKLENTLEKRQIEQQKQSNALNAREQQLNQKFDVLDGKEQALHRQEEILTKRENQIEHTEKQAENLLHERQTRIEALTGLTQSEARKMLVSELEESARSIAARKVRSIKEHAFANANMEAKEVITRSIQRYAGELVSENTVSIVELPTDDMKGRIIGRDGRNIRSFEMTTGVEIIVDDTPGIVMLSSFDPARREVATLTLEKLLIDGRIHPGRIEEVYDKALQEVEELTREAGSKAAFDLGIHDIAEPLLEILGKLRFHTSYNQNLLAHSKEVSMIAGIMAEQLGFDVTVARRAGLLHDIGKTLESEPGRDSNQLGADIARKCGETPEVIQVLETHSTNFPSRPATATLIDAANEISVCRPGSRKDTAEEYAQRLKHIETLAETHAGVRKAFALQNGKEIRVLVDSEIVDDTYSEQIAEEFVEKLENELDQVGQIRVCLIREVRSVHYAR